MLLKRTVDSIIGGLSKMEAKLIQLAEAKSNEVANISSQVAALQTYAAFAREEGNRATRVAAKLRDITK